MADSGTNTTFMATLHSKSGTSDNWSGTKASAWNITHDAGYYVDVPVWIRSSSKDEVKLSVDAYVKPDTTAKAFSGASVELYKAARVAILPGAGSTGSGTMGVINLHDGSGSGWTGARDVVNYYGKSGTHGIEKGAVKASGTADGSYTGNQQLLQKTGQTSMRKHKYMVGVR